MCVGLIGPQRGRLGPAQSTCTFKIVSKNFSQNIKHLLLKIFYWEILSSSLIFSMCTHVQEPHNMNLAASQLRQIIREELTRSLNEDQDSEFKWNKADKYVSKDWTGPLTHIREVQAHPPGQPWGVHGLPLPGGYIVLKSEDNTRKDNSGKTSDGYQFADVGKDPLTYKSWSELMDSIRVTYHIFKDDLAEMTEAASDKNQKLPGFGAGLPKGWSATVG